MFGILEEKLRGEARKRGGGENANALDGVKGTRSERTFAKTSSGKSWERRKKRVPGTDLSCRGERAKWRGEKKKTKKLS